MEHLLDDTTKRSWTYRDREESRRIALGLESEINFDFKFILTWNFSLKNTKEYVSRVVDLLDKAAFRLNKQHVFAVLFWDYQPERKGKPLHFHVLVSLEHGRESVSNLDPKKVFEEAFMNIEGQDLRFFDVYDSRLGAAVYGLEKHRGFSFFTGCPNRKRICKRHKRTSGRCFFDNNEKRKRIFKKAV